MSNKKNYYLLLIKMYKRNINTDLLYNAMQKMQNNTIIQQSKSIKKDEVILKMEKLKEKIEIKVNSEKYETIQENLNESLKIMKELNKNFENLKENSLNIDIKIKKEQDLIQETNLDTLNKGLKNIREINQDNNIILEKNKIINENTDIYINKISNVKKSIFNIEWLQPFLDFMHNHSTLVLTIGSGLIMGGMWYMNNIGYLNIGSLLTRLGITIFSTPQNSTTTTVDSNNQIAINTGSINDRTGLARGFFRELGQKVLEILDIVIEKVKDKRQKYK